MKERRLFPRAKLKCRISVIMDLRILVFNSDVENIGAGGLRVLLQERLESTTPVKLEVFPIDKEFCLKCNGDIIWSSENQEKRSFDTGIRFLDIDDGKRSQISQLVNLFLSQESNA